MPGSVADHHDNAGSDDDLPRSCKPCTWFADGMVLLGFPVCVSKNAAESGLRSVF